MIPVMPNPVNSPPTANAQLFKLELDTLFQISYVLSRSLNLQETLKDVLEVLDEQVGMQHGMVTLLDSRSEELFVSAIHVPHLGEYEKVRYQPGEGVLGRVLEEGELIVLERISDEPRFLDRLGIYDRNLPFIAVPIRSRDQVVGVLTAQPRSAACTLDECVRFMEMVANLIVQSVRPHRQIEEKRQYLNAERDGIQQVVRGQYGFDNIIGNSPSMQQVFELVRQVAKWDTTVLIRGESGTGKELIANAIHSNSPRAEGPFIKLNCAALPDNLLESELFGHEKGAFTGAVNQRKGRFERADGGTLFLDEIGEISTVFQVKLLRVLQEGEFERVGGMHALKANVRIIAATNCDLEAAVEAGTFREDMYYRLNVMPIYMPPLRERLEDVAALARFLLNKLAVLQRRQLKITESALRFLLRYDWPGNVRELENCLERAAVMSESGTIDRDIISLSGIREHNFPAKSASTFGKSILDNPDLDERERVIAALEEAGWVQARAARLLGMTPRQIAYRIQTLNIRMREI
jgi:Nif-specific regulatory protein